MALTLYSLPQEGDNQLIMAENDASVILDGMTEVEMAFYAKYKLKKHSRDSRRKLTSALLNKGLTSERIKEITSSQKFSKNHQDGSCTRCGSSKVYHHKTDDSAEKKIHCLICGFVEGSKKKAKFKILEFLLGN